MSQDAKEKDQERMTNSPTLVDKLQAGYQTTYIINDFEEKGTSYTFSEASRRTKNWEISYCAGWVRFSKQFNAQGA